ncbi:hypothetical protein EW146_g5250 [Bondarzewia mesenterica]|uniref:Endopeptidase S2P n=1 Tax=Bondarzewia mesenterica TaxID=1095465 RepID=A0A4S4LSP2_9AGAM|nr:hypothetical protein EW146_g5250 [Bondarzewia mesenterica]
MTPGSLILYLCLIWLLFYGIIRARARPSILPNPLSLSPRRPRSLFSTDATRLTVNKLHLRVESTALNAYHDVFTARLTSRPYGRLRRILSAFYDSGTLSGAIGMFSCMVLLAWTVWQLGFTLLSSSSSSKTPGDVQAVAVHTKRGFDDASVPATDSYAGDRVQLELLVSAFTHTCVLKGHCVELSDSRPDSPPSPTSLSSSFPSSSLKPSTKPATPSAPLSLPFSDGVPLLSLGASLTVIFPTAFVSLPTSTLLSLPARARARIAAAGALHNLVLYLILFTIGRTGISGPAFRALGYEDVRSQGRVALAVDQDSPLAAHIPQGSLVTKLDDTLLGTGTPTSLLHDIWETYLSTNRIHNATSGCQRTFALTPLVLRTAQSDICCNPPFSPSSPSLACFISTNTGETRCLDPVPILVPTTAPRCAPDSGCSDAGDTCVQPREADVFLRITVSDGNDGNERVILWRGPRNEVYEQIRVGTLRPRWTFLPLSFPSTFILFFEYLQTLTLSLFFFNLLPLPRLDGTQFLEALLEFYAGKDAVNEEVALEEMEGGQFGGRWNSESRHQWEGKGKKWRERMCRSIKAAAAGLVGGCVLLAAGVAVKGIWT